MRLLFRSEGVSDGVKGVPGVPRRFQWEIKKYSRYMHMFEVQLGDYILEILLLLAENLRIFISSKCYLISHLILSN